MCHLRRKTGLVYEDQLLQIEIELTIKPGSSALQGIQPVFLI